MHLDLEGAVALVADRIAARRVHHTYPNQAPLRRVVRNRPVIVSVVVRLRRDFNPATLVHVRHVLEGHVVEHARRLPGDGFLGPDHEDLLAVGARQRDGRQGDVETITHIVRCRVLGVLDQNLPVAGIVRDTPAIGSRFRIVALYDGTATAALHEVALPEVAVVDVNFGKSGGLPLDILGRVDLPVFPTCRYGYLYHLDDLDHPVAVVAGTAVVGIAHADVVRAGIVRNRPVVRSQAGIIRCLDGGPALALLKAVRNAHICNAPGSPGDLLDRPDLPDLATHRQGHFNALGNGEDTVALVAGPLGDTGADGADPHQTGRGHVVRNGPQELAIVGGGRNNRLPGLSFHAVGRVLDANTGELTHRVPRDALLRSHGEHFATVGSRHRDLGCKNLEGPADRIRLAILRVRDPYLPDTRIVRNRPLVGTITGGHITGNRVPVHQPVLDVHERDSRMGPGDRLLGPDLPHLAALRRADVEELADLEANIADIARSFIPGVTDLHEPLSGIIRNVPQVGTARGS